MLDIEVMNIAHEVKFGPKVISVLPDVRLGHYTPLPRHQLMCVADEMADLGAEKTNQLMQKITHIGILDAFMTYIKILRTEESAATKYAVIEQMKAMRARYGDILHVEPANGMRSSFWDFFYKKEDIMDSVAKETTPVQLLGVLMGVHSEYRRTANPRVRSFMTRGVMAGIEYLKNRNIEDVLERTAQEKYPQFVESSKQNGKVVHKISFGCWYDSQKSKSPKRNYRAPRRYGGGIASRFGFDHTH